MPQIDASKQLIDINNPPMTSKEYEEFPRMVFRGAENKIVKSEEELEAALAKGWAKEPVVASQEESEDVVVEEKPKKGRRFGI